MLRKSNNSAIGTILYKPLEQKPMTSPINVTASILFGICGFAVLLFTESMSDPVHRFTYHETKMTWYMAVNACKEEGGSLLTMNNQEKLNLLNEDPIRSTIFSDELWIGLKALDDACNAYKWHSLNASINWTNWALNEPDNCETEGCVRIVQSKWRTRNCDSYYRFICENVIIFGNGQSTVSSQTDGTEGGNGQSTVSSQTDGTEGGNEESTVSSQTDGAEGGNEQSTVSSQTDGAEGGINNPTSNTPEVTVTSNENSISSEVYIGTQTPVMSTLDAIVEKDQSTTHVNDATSTQTVLKTGISTVIGQTVSPVGTSIDTEQTTTQVIATKDGQDDSTMTPKYCAEECREYRLNGCPPVLWDGDGSVSDTLRLAIKKLKEELRVRKTETQLYIRGKTSVYEKRTSAEAIGSMGIIVIAAVCGFVVLLDFPKLVKYFQSHINADNA